MPRGIQQVVMSARLRLVRTMRDRLSVWTQMTRLHLAPAKLFRGCLALKAQVRAL